MKISVMIPVWNEEKRLASCIDSLLEYGSKNLDGNMEIIVCADGCTDETVNIANSYARRYPNVKLAEWPDRLGKGGGILNGVKMVDGDVVVITDVDLSASPEEIQKLVSPINSGKADFVVGSRSLAGSTITKKAPIHRIFLGRAFNFLFRMFFHADFHDTQCGFKAIKTGVLIKLCDDLTIEGYAFDIDLIVKALRHGYRVVEVSIVWGYKTGSKVDSLRQSYEMARSLLIVWLENLKREPK